MRLGAHRSPGQTSNGDPTRHSAGGHDRRMPAMRCGLHAATRKRAGATSNGPRCRDVHRQFASSPGSRGSATATCRARRRQHDPERALATAGASVGRDVEEYAGEIRTREPVRATVRSAPRRGGEGSGGWLPLQAASSLVGAMPPGWAGDDGLPRRGQAEIAVRKREQLIAKESFGTPDQFLGIVARGYGRELARLFLFGATATGWRSPGRSAPARPAWRCRHLVGITRPMTTQTRTSSVAGH